MLLLLTVLISSMPAAGLGPSEVLELFHLSRNDRVATARLVIEGAGVSGEVVDSETRVEASFSVDAAGKLLRYRRELRGLSPARLISRISLSAQADGYRLREEGPLGARTRDLSAARIDVVLDAAWPDALVPLFLARVAGPKAVFVVASSEVQTVELAARESSAWFLDVKAGGITAWLSAEGRFRKMLLPGVSDLSIVSKEEADAPAPTPGVREETVTVGEGAAGFPAILARPEAGEDARAAVVLLGDAGPRDEDGRLPGSRSMLQRTLAHELVRGGFVTLRYAKRDRRDQQADFKALVAEAAAAAEFLGRQSGVRPGRIAFLGIGEGSLVATVAVAERPGLVAAVLALNPPAKPLATALPLRLSATLRASGEREAAIREAVDALTKELARLRALAPEVNPGPGQGVLRAILDLDLLAPLSRLGPTPWLGILGDADPGVPSEDRAHLSSAILLQREPNRRFQLLAGADAEFRKNGSAAATVDDVARPLHPDLLPIATAFLREFLGNGQ